MKLEQATLKNYRNIAQMTVDPCEGINVIFGENAQGKTNLIEGIWLFTGNPSFRGAKSGELIRFEEKEAQIAITFADSERSQQAEILLGEKKKILLNRVELRSNRDLNGNFYAVVFSPTHLSLIKDGPRERRKFLDTAISQITPQYQRYLATYEKILEQRNALLKNAYRYVSLQENIAVWDEQLAKAGTILSIYRGDYVRRLEPLARSIYAGLSGNREEFSIAYRSTVFADLSEVTSYEQAHVEQYLAALKESFDADVKQGFTSVGVHRDDLDITINGHLAQIYGSQGQQRSCVITLKLGEADLLQKVTGEAPIMLLDDVMSELDTFRQEYILNELHDMQVFITCCDIFNTIKMRAGKIFHIENGVLTDVKKIEEAL